MACRPLRPWSVAFLYLCTDCLATVKQFCPTAEQKINISLGFRRCAPVLSLHHPPQKKTHPKKKRTKTNKKTYPPKTKIKNKNETKKIPPENKKIHTRIKPPQKKIQQENPNKSSSQQYYICFKGIWNKSLADFFIILLHPIKSWLNFSCFIYPVWTHLFYTDLTLCYRNIARVLNNQKKKVTKVWQLHLFLMLTE